MSPLLSLPTVQSWTGFKGMASSAVEGIPDINGVFNRETTVGRILNAKPEETLSVKVPAIWDRLSEKHPATID